jgi:ABC-type dipeptide/oligopeptide/nickel transport system ATPase component
MALLDIQNLRVEFGAEADPFIAVDGLALQIDRVKWSASSANPVPARA